MQEPNGKKIQLNTTAFLHAKKSREFMGDLWRHLLSAQQSADGIAQSLVEAKSAEIRHERVRRQRQAESGRKRSMRSDAERWTGRDRRSERGRQERPEKVAEQAGRDREAAS